MTEPTPRIQAVHATGAMLVEHCDVPEHMTLGEWRRANAAGQKQRRGLVSRVLRRAA
jgi:hypothetical protein